MRDRMVTTTDINEVISKAIALRKDVELLARCSGADGAPYVITVMNPMTNTMDEVAVPSADYDELSARASGIAQEIKDAVSGWAWPY